MKLLASNSPEVQDGTPFAQLPSLPARAVEAERVVVPFYGYTTRGGTPREKATVHHTTPSQSSGAGAANTSESVQTSSRSHLTPPPLHQTGRFRTHPDLQPHEREPSYPQPNYGLDPHVESPPSYQINSSAPIHRESI